MSSRLLRFFFLLALVVSFGRPAAHASARHPDGVKDTVVVRLPNQATLMLLVRDANQLRQLSNYHLDSLTVRLAGYIKQAENAAQAATTDQVTMEFYPDKDRPGQNLPEQIRITTNKKNPNTNRIDVALNKAFGITVTRDETEQGSYIIGKNSEAKAKAKADTAKSKKKEDPHKVYLRFDFGLNTLVNRGSSAAGAVPSLDTWGSNYLNVGLNFNAPLVHNKRTHLGIAFGPEVAFNDLQLRGDDVWVEKNGRTFAEAAGTEVQVDEARLLMTTLNTPLMLKLQLRNARGKRGLSAGIGGFGGYRIATSTKVEYNLAGNDDDREDKRSGGFHLNNWHYGLQAEIGYRSLTFFAKYHLNELFQTDRGPQAQVLSFGINLFDL